MGLAARSPSEVSACASARTLLAGERCARVVSCTVIATGPVFGIYGPLNAAPLDSNVNLAVTCTLLSGATTSVTPQVRLGTGSSGTYMPRTMVFAAQRLNHNIYFSNACAPIWGGGTGGSFYGVATLTLRPGNPTQQATGVLYGEIPPLEDVGAGAYLDTIVVTVTY
jgi:spore coat protein U domain-containing protein, fimbrial subunit CupE1/2/3/6